MDDGSSHAHPLPKSQELEDDLLNAADPDALDLSEKEKLVLQLFNQLRELELERSLLEAHQNDASSASPSENLSDDEIARQLVVAEREAMEARATYLLRNKITDQVLITDPVIKAVHGGSQASYEERRLLPHLHARDVLSLHLSNLTQQYAATTTRLAVASKDLAAANATNAALASTLLSLATPSTSSTDQEAAAALTAHDAKQRDALLAAEKDVAAARRRWRTVKGVVAGVVVGSGVDWAADEGLRELVLEDEDELVEGEVA
ncbi:centromere protein H (CENP-H)-domain-containing protein [Macrophomina phaseolina]|nr:centromere protein H (CENP-H)-domain-containing protein [Macrophomina phaseolina]